MYTDATFSKGVITAYGSTTDISSNLGPCVHSGYGAGLQITNADNQTVVGQDFGETINVNEAINDIFGEYSLIGTATGDGGALSSQRPGSGRRHAGQRGGGRGVNWWGAVERGYSGDSVVNGSTFASTVPDRA